MSAFLKNGKLLSMNFLIEMFSCILHINNLAFIRDLSILAFEEYFEIKYTFLSWMSLSYSIFQILGFLLMNKFGKSKFTVFSISTLTMIILSIIFTNLEILHNKFTCQIFACLIGALSTYSFLITNHTTLHMANKMGINQSELLSVVILLSSGITFLINHITYFSFKAGLICICCNWIMSFILAITSLFNDCDKLKISTNQQEKDAQAWTNILSTCKNKYLSYFNLLLCYICSTVGLHYIVFGLPQDPSKILDPSLYQNPIFFASFFKLGMCLAYINVLISKYFCKPRARIDSVIDCAKVFLTLLFTYFICYKYQFLNTWITCTLFTLLSFYGSTIHMFMFDIIKYEFANSNTLLLTTLFNMTCTLGMSMLSNIEPMNLISIANTATCITLSALVYLRSMSFEKNIYNNAIKVNFIKQDVKAITPNKNTCMASGFDVFSCENKILKSKTVDIIDTGLIIDAPMCEGKDGYMESFEIQVRSRSGLALKGIFVLNSPGTIDFDYTGRINIILANFSNEDFVITQGMKIAQIVFSKIHTNITLNEVSSYNELTFFDVKNTLRGTKGFGSSGE